MKLKLVRELKSHKKGFCKYSGSKKKANETKGGQALSQVPREAAETPTLELFSTSSGTALSNLK